MRSDSKVHCIRSSIQKGYSIPSNYIIAISYVIVLGLSSCSSKTGDSNDSVNQLIEIPVNSVKTNQLDYAHQTSTWTLNKQPFSGYAVEYYDSGSLKAKTGILKGKKEHRSIKWYEDGRKKEVAYYRNGKLHGEKKRWSSDSTHILLAELNYVDGKPHGLQKLWYPTGELYKKLNLNMGREEGLQQAFRKNGVIYANYEAWNGRIFGLKKATLCYGLEDEKINFKE